MKNKISILMLTIFFILGLGTNAFADRVSCLKYLLVFSGRTERLSPKPYKMEAFRMDIQSFGMAEILTEADGSIESWIAALHESGLSDLAELVEQEKIELVESSHGRSPVSWKMNRLGKSGRGYTVIVREGAKGVEAFWDFATALYDIYFYRSLWNRSSDFWQTKDFEPGRFRSRAPQYLASLRRITPKMYMLFSNLTQMENLSLPGRDYREPSTLMRALRVWSSASDHRLNQRDFETFVNDGEKTLLEKMQNRLTARVVAGQYAGYVAKSIAVFYIYTATMSAYHLPAQIHMVSVLKDPMVTTAHSMNAHPETFDRDFQQNLKLGFNEQVSRRDQLRAMAQPLTSDLKEELTEIEGDIKILLEDHPDLAQN